MEVQHTILVCVALAGMSLAAPLSLRADEKALIAAGIPAISREWKGEDYVQTAGVLAAGKVPLPLYSDDQGHLFLDRLTSVENLSFCSDENLPMETRLNDFSKVASGASSILVQYAGALNKGKNAHAECAHMLVFVLKVAAVGEHLADELVPTLPKDDKYPVRMDGLKKMRSGLTQVFAGAEQSLSEKIYTAQDFSLLLDAMTETLPAIKTSFTDGYKLELQQKLKADKAAFQQPKDLQDLQKMLDELGK